MEIYDYLRLLYARIGTPCCPGHNIAIAAPDTVLVRQVLKNLKKSGMRERAGTLPLNY